MLLRRNAGHGEYLDALRTVGTSANTSAVVNVLERMRATQQEFVESYLGDGPDPLLLARHGQALADLQSYLPLLVTVPTPPAGKAGRAPANTTKWFILLTNCSRKKNAFLGRKYTSSARKNSEL